MTPSWQESFEFDLPGIYGSGKNAEVRRPLTFSRLRLRTAQHCFGCHHHASDRTALSANTGSLLTQPASICTQVFNHGGAGGVVTLSIWDKDVLGKDDLLGSFRLDLHAMTGPMNRLEDVWIEAEGRVPSLAEFKKK